MGKLTLGGPSGQTLPQQGLLKHAKVELQSREGESRSLKEVAADFESLFLNLVLKSMRDTVPKSELLNGGNAEDVYRSMLDSEYAQQMAKLGQTGLAASIEKQLQEKIGRAHYQTQLLSPPASSAQQIEVKNKG